MIVVSLALPALGQAPLKMMLFDNKSEFHDIIDMPVGMPVEQTAAVLHELGCHPLRVHGHRLVRRRGLGARSPPPVRA